MIALSLAVAYGIWYAYGVFLVALLKEYGWSRSLLAGAFSVFTLVHGGANPLVGALCTRFQPMRVMAVGGTAMGLALFADSFISSPWQLYAGFGVLTAVSVCAAGWVPSLVHVQREYQERLGLSIGIISSGVGVGMMLFVPLTQWLIDAFGWRWAFRVLALLAVAWIVPSSFWLLKSRRQSPQKQTQEKSGSDLHRSSQRISHLTLKDAMRTQPFWLLVAAFFFGNVCSQTLHVHQVAYLVDHGLPAIVAASVVGVVGLSSIAGKTGGGWLSDRIDRELVYMAGVGIMAGSVLVLLALGAAPSRWGAYGYAVLLGVGYSVTAAITPAMMSDRFSGPHFGSIIGIGMLGSAVGSAFGPWLAGQLFDATQSYTVPFLIAVGCAAVAITAGARLRSLRRAARPAHAPG